MISNIKIKGFQSHEESSLDLSKGFNVILGPTDSGKSALVRSLFWLAFNRPSGASYVRKSSKSCSVEITTDKGVAARIKVPENGYKVNGDMLTAVGSSVPDELKDVVDLGSINFQSQLDPYFLILESPGQFSRLVSDILELDLVDKAISLAKGSTSKLNSTYKGLHRDVSELKSKLALKSGLDELLEIKKSSSSLLEEINLEHSCYENLKNLVDDIEFYDKGLEQCNYKVSKLANLSDIIANCNSLALELKKFELSGLVSTIEDLSDELERISNNLANTDNLEDISTSLSSTLSLVSDLAKLRAICKDYIKLEGELSSLNEKLEVLELSIKEVKNDYVSELKSSGTCPTCHSTISSELANSLIEKI